MLNEALEASRDKDHDMPLWRERAKEPPLSCLKPPAKLAGRLLLMGVQVADDDDDDDDGSR